MEEKWGILRLLNYGDSSPEGYLDGYRDTIRRLVKVRKRLKNPLTLNGERPLKPASIRELEGEERRLSKAAEQERAVIKYFARYNLLPSSKLISEESRCQFIFSLRTMILFPFLGHVVRFANRLSDMPSLGDKEPEKEKGLIHETLIELLENAIKELKREKHFYVKGSNRHLVKKPKPIPENIVSLESYKAKKEDLLFNSLVGKYLNEK